MPFTESSFSAEVGCKMYRISAIISERDGDGVSTNLAGEIQANEGLPLRANVTRVRIEQYLT